MKDFPDQFLTEHPSFTTAEFTAALRSAQPDIGRSTVYAALKTLCDGKRISKLGRGYYSVTQKPVYDYELSAAARAFSSAIREAYPLVDFQIWELYQMNEFVNHQLARNTVFVEVESMQDESVFELLFARCPHVLLNPDIDEYYRYAGEETVVIQRLVSESPQPYGEYRQTSLEKLLVDLFAHGLSSSLLSRSEYPAILSDAFSKYSINQTKLLRYARRRGAEKKLLAFLGSQTDIILEAAS